MSSKIQLYKAFNSTKGSTSIIIICTTVIVILLSALVSDVGYAALERYRLVKGAEEAAREGAVLLLSNRHEAVKKARECMVKKVQGLNKLEVIISENSRDITVYGGKPIEYLFLRALGMKNKQIDVSTTARLSCVSSYKGVKPFAIQEQKLAFDREYYLTMGSSVEWESIGLVPLSIGEGNYRVSIIYGYRKLLNVGDGIYALSNADNLLTQNGISNLLSKCSHIPSCTHEAFVDACPRVMVIPVVDRLEHSGNKAMNVKGFAAFFLEGGGFKNKNFYIKGRFLKYTLKAGTSDAVKDFGLSGIKVITQ